MKLSRSPALRARIELRVTPGAPRTRWIGPYGTRWKLAVAAPPERGKANEEVCAAVAAACGVPRDRVTVVSGATSRDKTVEVVGIDAARLAEDVARVCLA